jgi:hypothetical protein
MLVLLILGFIIGIIGAITYQWMLEFITIGIIVLVLIFSDLKIRIHGDADKSDNKLSQESVERINESLNSLRKEVGELEKRMEIQEKR